MKPLFQLFLVTALLDASVAHAGGDAKNGELILLLALHCLPFH